MLLQWQYFIGIGFKWNSFHLDSSMTPLFGYIPVIFKSTRDIQQNIILLPTLRLRVNAIKITEVK